MENNEIRAYLEKMKFCRLTRIRCACEMLVFDFGPCGLHAQNFTRVVKNGKILLTTLDYQSWDRENDENNDEWRNLDRYRDEIVGGVVSDVRLNELNDLTVTLDNGVTIECFAANGETAYDEEREFWRALFDVDETIVTHIVATNVSLDVETSEEETDSKE
jgi:hypothetical protein